MTKPSKTLAENYADLNKKFQLYKKAFELVCEEISGLYQDYSRTDCEQEFLKLAKEKLEEKKKEIEKKQKEKYSIEKLFGISEQELREIIKDADTRCDPRWVDIAEENKTKNENNN